MIVGTGVLYAAANRRDSSHASCKGILESTARLVIPALVVAEAAYLIGETLGPEAETAFIRSMSTDRYLVDGPTRGHLTRAATLMSEYESLPLGATDATVLALAERSNDRQIAALDRPKRLFRKRAEWRTFLQVV